MKGPQLIAWHVQLNENDKAGKGTRVDVVQAAVGHVDLLEVDQVDRYECHVCQLCQWIVIHVNDLYLVSHGEPVKSNHMVYFGG